MSDTPLYDATLADQLQRARREGELARARWTLAERAAGERAAEAERTARAAIAKVEREAAQAIARAVAEAERTVAHAQRESRLRQALVAEQTEERVREALALSAPALPTLRTSVLIDLDEERPEREAPPVPSMEDLMRPMPGINRFLDSLLGAPET